MKCYCGGTKSARISLRGTKYAVDIVLGGTKSARGPNPLIHRQSFFLKLQVNKLKSTSNVPLWVKNHKAIQKLAFEEKISS